MANKRQNRFDLIPNNEDTPRQSSSRNFDITDWSAPWNYLVEAGTNTWCWVKDCHNSNAFKYSSKIDVPSGLTAKDSSLSDTTFHSCLERSTSASVSSASQNTPADQEIINQDKYLDEKYGLKRCRIIPDGNCLYRSVSQALSRDQSQHMIIRKEVVQFIERNLDRFESLIEGDTSDYLIEASSENTWGGYLEILAMTELFDINIIIVLGGSTANSSCTETIHHFSGEITPKETVWLSWLSTGHYDLIVDYTPDDSEYQEWIAKRKQDSLNDQRLAIQLSQETQDEIPSSSSDDYETSRRRRINEARAEEDHKFAIALQKHFDQHDTSLL